MMRSVSSGLTVVKAPRGAAAYQHASAARACAGCCCRARSGWPSNRYRARALFMCWGTRGDVVARGTPGTGARDGVRERCASGPPIQGHLRRDVPLQFPLRDPQHLAEGQPRRDDPRRGRAVLHALAAVPLGPSDRRRAVHAPRSRRHRGGNPGTLPFALPAEFSDDRRFPAIGPWRSWSGFSLMEWGG